MPVTELDQASINLESIRELDNQIVQMREFQLSCKKAGDNIGDMTWANGIKKLKAQKHQLTENIRYVELKTFASVIKTYLTPNLYNEAWRKVDELIENPNLMQDWRNNFKERGYAEVE